MAHRLRRLLELWFFATAVVIGWCLPTPLPAAAVSATAPDLGAVLSRETLEVNWRDNGRPYRVGVGSQIFIALPASPRQIGRWQWLRSATDQDVVMQLQKPRFLARPEGATDEIEGFQEFSFVAEGPGPAVLMLRFKKLKSADDGGGDDQVDDDQVDDDQVDDKFRITIDVF